MTPEQICEDGFRPEDAPTPETDAWEQRYSRSRHWTNFARTLERDRNRLRALEAAMKAASDEKLLSLLVSQCDTLDITRVHEMKAGGFEATTIFSNDAALLRVVKNILLTASAPS